MILQSNEIKGLLTAWSDTMNENRDYLIDLDSVFGDGDLGLTMSDGFKAASDNAEKNDSEDLGILFYNAGKAMSTAVPSTMGTLMATGLMEIGKSLKGKTSIELYDIHIVFSSFMDGVMKRGKAKLGEKTFLDGISPAVEVLISADPSSDMKVILDKAGLAAREGAENTKTMLAVHGRAAIRGEQSRTLIDPGAVVAKLLVETAVRFLSR